MSQVIFLLPTRVINHQFCWHICCMRRVRMKTFCFAFLAIATTLTLTSTGCAVTASDAVESDITSAEDDLRVVGAFSSRGTGYYPDSSALEGGFVDMLQGFLRGSSPYVSVAMDKSAFPYGTRLRIAELNAKYGREIIFRMVDTGGAFRGKGQSRMDICTQNRAASLDPVINGRLSVQVINERLPPVAPAEPVASPQPAARQVAGAGAASEGIACTSDGACNPGNNGSGLVCTAGKCVDGCRSDAQCPGVTTCEAGFCR
jgi:3D (Asp-Asp-Asp) domain-containing protein